MSEENTVNSDMLYCKKCGRFRAHLIYSDGYICYGCKRKTKYDSEEIKKWKNKCLI